MRIFVEFFGIWKRISLNSIKSLIPVFLMTIPRDVRKSTTTLNQRKHRTYVNCFEGKRKRHCTTTNETIAPLTILQTSKNIEKLWLKSTSLGEVRFLLENGLHPDTRRSGTLETMLYFARDIDLAKLLLEYGADIDNVFPDSEFKEKSVQERWVRFSMWHLQIIEERGFIFTPNMVDDAIMVDNIEKLKWLLQRVPGKRCDEALLTSCRSIGNWVGTRLLLEAGANPNAQHSDGDTCIMVVSESFTCAAKLKKFALLLEFGADIKQVHKTSEKW